MHKSDGPRTTGQSDGPYNFCGLLGTKRIKMENEVEKFEK